MSNLIPFAFASASAHVISLQVECPAPLTLTKWSEWSFQQPSRHPLITLQLHSHRISIQWPGDECEGGRETAWNSEWSTRYKELSIHVFNLSGDISCKRPLSQTMSEFNFSFIHGLRWLDVRSCSLLTHWHTWRLTNRGQKSTWPINVVTRSSRKEKQQRQQRIGFSQVTLDGVYVPIGENAFCYI